MDAKFNIFSLMAEFQAYRCYHQPFLKMVAYLRGKPLNWIASGILTEVTGYCFKNITWKTQGSAKRG